ncbi:type IV toxin-antitoxin system AbiEi family antitoxin domain-containing protein [Nocardioides nanhaiensis]|uniref:Type IV toxin-antitoxin system AbiEi family antitoxin domain-containing protein n=1 Tax=Nocardioides nanhaiensis TaxID=1476871 RepID=A0ABP8VXB5_9ACTN
MNAPTRNRPVDDPRNGPVMLRRDLLASGMSDKHIDKLVRQGALARVRHGAYTQPAIWQGLDDVGRFLLRGRAVVASARTPSLLSHTSAVAEYGGPTWGLSLDRVHTTRTDGLSGRRCADVTQHRGAVLLEDVGYVNGLPVTSPARAALECTLLGHTAAALCVVNFFLFTGMVTEKELQIRAVEMEQWTNSMVTDLVLRLANPLIESVGETRFDHFCFREGIPRPIAQKEIKDEHGNVKYRVDFAWPEYGVFLEFDGLVKYGRLLRPGETASDAVVRDRLREDDIREITGWRCIRITWADLADPVRLARRIEKFLGLV